LRPFLNSKISKPQSADNCLHISLFLYSSPYKIKYPQATISLSRTRTLSLFRPNSRQANAFFRHHRGRSWYRDALVFIDHRGTISRCSTDSRSALLVSNLPFCPAFLFSPPDNRASRRNANGSARTSPARVLCHEKRPRTASSLTENTALARV
jgi:hypothetical protein